MCLGRGLSPPHPVIPAAVAWSLWVAAHHQAPITRPSFKLLNLPCTSAISATVRGRRLQKGDPPHPCCPLLPSSLEQQGSSCHPCGLVHLQCHLCCRVPSHQVTPPQLEATVTLSLALLSSPLTPMSPADLCSLVFSCRSFPGSQLPLSPGENHGNHRVPPLASGRPQNVGHGAGHSDTRS